MHLYYLETFSILTIHIWAQNYNSSLKLRKTLVKVTNVNVQKYASKNYKEHTYGFYYINHILFFTHMYIFVKVVIGFNGKIVTL